jgi:hypothetical protein
MLVATSMMVVGLLVGVAAAQLAGLRLGGVIVVPLLSVYLLRSFGSFPIFLASVIAAYVTLHVVKSRLLLFGRPLFLVAIVVGTLVPLTMFELFAVQFEIRAAINEVEFLGSILPGIAAYNFHRLEQDRRILDMVWSLAVILFLVVVGIGLVIVVGLTPLAEALPPVLLSNESDIARAFGLTVGRPYLPVIASHRVTFGLVVLGTVLSELARIRYGYRIAGVIVLPLVVLAAFRSGSMLGLWIAVTVLSYVGIVFVNRWTLLYGRVLLSMSVVFGVLATSSVTPVLDVQNGLLPFFVGILAGVSAYNLHVVPPVERRETIALGTSVFVIIAGVARLFIVPLPAGILSDVASSHLLVGGVLLLPGLLVVYRAERLVGIVDRPGGGQGPVSTWTPSGDTEGTASPHGVHGVGRRSARDTR